MIMFNNETGIQLAKPSSSLTKITLDVYLTAKKRLALIKKSEK